MTLNTDGRASAFSRNLLKKKKTGLEIKIDSISTKLKVLRSSSREEQEVEASRSIRSRKTLPWDEIEHNPINP